MIRSAVRYSAMLLAGALLVACGDEAVERDTSGDARTAAGEVRGGTISDAMLPLDSVRSQNPGLASETGGASSPSAQDGSEAQSSDAPTAEDPDAAIDALADDMADDTAASTGDYEL